MMGLDLVNAVGFAAAAMTLATFVQRRMLPMRISAIGANILFISYGFYGSFYPVLILHLLLLPVNLTRLLQEAGSMPLQDRSMRPFCRTSLPLLEEWRLGSSRLR